MASGDDATKLHVTVAVAVAVTVVNAATAATAVVVEVVDNNKIYETESCWHYDQHDATDLAVWTQQHEQHGTMTAYAGCNNMISSKRRRRKRTNNN